MIRNDNLDIDWQRIDERKKEVLEYGNEWKWDRKLEIEIGIDIITNNRIWKCTEIGILVIEMLIII